jgi:hypothetical protein
MHQAVLADVQEAAAGAAVPGIRQSPADILLKAVEVGEGKQRVFVLEESLVYFAMIAAQRLQLPAMIVQNAQRTGEAKRPRAPGNRQRIAGIANARAQHGVDRDPEFGMLLQPFQLAVQHLQALFRDFIRPRVVDADLQVIQAGAIEPLDAFPG